MKKSSLVAIVLSLIAICLSCTCLALMLLKPQPTPPAPGSAPAPADAAAPAPEAGDIQYVVYVGTNDKDSNEPVFTPEEARTVLEDMLLDSMGGYTIQEARGGWIGDDGTEYQEYTLVIYLSDTDIDTVHALCDQLIETYHQSSILIQSNVTTTEFYAG